MRTAAIAIIAALLSSTSAFAQEADAWRKVADSVPLGSKVKIQTYEGKRINGTLMRVDGSQILVKRNTRRPEPAVTLMFDDMSKLERDQNGGSNLAKAAVIGLATGAGVIFSLFLIALQFD
jgi:hypothetical protein